MINRKLVELLRRLAELYNVLDETYRHKAYVTAANSIAGLNVRVTRKYLEEHKIRGVGTGIREKIEEYIDTGAIRELERLEKSPSVKRITELQQIPGVGIVTARAWLAEGIRSVRDVRRAVDSGRLSLTHMQRVGLDHYEDIVKRIPRETVEEVAGEIGRLLRGVGRDLKIVTLGSYRRMKATSGDIDMMCSERHHDPTLIEKFVRVLRDRPQFIDTLSAGRQRVTFLYRDKGGTARQVDLFYAKWEEYIPYMLYATGSGSHNEMMRGVAKAQGMRLNQTGLYRAGKLIPVTSERQIYKILGIPYVPPEKRD